VKKGDTVMIYQDPLTKRKPESEAGLIEKMQEDPHQEFWLVRFGDDGYVTGRWIKKEGESHDDSTINKK